jgi:cysteine protease, calpain family
MPADSFKVMTGKSATTLESDGSEGSYNPIEKVDIITASILHQPMVASTVATDATYTDGMASVDATVDGRPTQIDLYGAHAYTVVSADTNGVTLCNPHGNNPKTGGGEEPATFTLSWDNYEKYYGNTTIGSR